VWVDEREPVKASKDEVEAFLFHEAELLDERRLEEWLELFTEDGVFWVPIADGTDPEHEASVIYDDARLRTQRVYQLLHQPHYAQIPPSRTAHYITNVRLVAEQPGGEIVVRCNVLVAEQRPGEHQQLQAGLGTRRLLAGRCEYRLRPRNGGWAIALKKVLLLDRDLPHYNLSFVF
jgi:3-phenylpropionate/cinnamic acid dioxygenase small subunit